MMKRQSPEEEIKLYMQVIPEWLKSLKGSAEKIVCFGCAGIHEPLSLIFELQGKEISIVDKDSKGLQSAYNDFNKLKTDPNTRKIMTNFEMKPPIKADITEIIPNLGDNVFDIVFCERVLYQIPSSEKLNQAQYVWVNNKSKENLTVYCEAMEDAIRQDGNKLQSAIVQMARIVKPSGYVIAVENTFRDRCPIDISHFFKNAGLDPVEIPDSPSYAYCYQKPNL